LVDSDLRDLECELAEECGSNIEPHLAEDSDALYNDKLSTLRLKREKPEHRIIVLLKAQGYSNKEIAERLEVTPVMVGYVLRQPWARERLVAEISASGRDAVNELLRGAVSDAVMTLIDVNQNGKPGERVSAANSLLDRYYGKPTQRVETDNTHHFETVDELDRQIKSLEEQEQALLGGRN
jgi:predicted transcriptional regulator